LSQESLTPQVSPTAALQSFLLDCESRRLSPKTLSFYRQQLTPFMAFLDVRKVTALRDLTADHIRIYLISRQHLKVSTQHAAARSIRAWLNFCVRDDLLAGSPMRAVKMPKLDKDLLPAFDKDEVARLLDACREVRLPERERAIVLVLLDSGLRASELVALKWADIDASGAITVRLGKGRKTRTAYLGAVARKALQKYHNTQHGAGASAPVFVSHMTGGHLTYAGLKQLIERLGDLAEVKNCHPHTFRRTAALTMLRSGMDLVRLAAILGHEDLDTLRRYLKLVPSDLQDAQREHGAVDWLLRK